MIGTAVKMCIALLAGGILVALVTRNPLPPLVVGLVMYSVWHVAKGFEE